MSKFTHPFAAAAAALALGGLLSPALAQDAAAGQRKAAQCIGCHGIPGYQASFPEIHRVPMISGQNDKYIVAALLAYKKGERKHPTMRAVAGSLSEQDMADLGAFYAQHGQGGASPTPVAAHQPSAEVDALLKKGACASCHGESLNKPIDPSYPKLAGQHADYLYAALKSYQTEGNPLVGRANAIMGGVAKPYTHAELKAMAGYIASLPGNLKSIPQSRFR